MMKSKSITVSIAILFMLSCDHPNNMNSDFAQIDKATPEVLDNNSVSYDLGSLARMGRLDIKIW